MMFKHNHLVPGLAVLFLILFAMAAPNASTSNDLQGRWKLDSSGCYWDANDDGPDQCDPNNGPGRWKDSPSGCYWEENDWGPDQCTPPSVWFNLNFVIRDIVTGLGISDANVQIDIDFGNGVTRTTDNAGFANFGVQAAQINFNVSAMGYASYAGDVDVSSHNTLYLSLLPLEAGPSGDEQQNPVEFSMVSYDPGLPPEQLSVPGILQGSWFYAAGPPTVQETGMYTNSKKRLTVTAENLSGQILPNVPLIVQMSLQKAEGHEHSTSNAPIAAIHGQPNWTLQCNTGSDGWGCQLQIDSFSVSAVLKLTVLGTVGEMKRVFVYVSPFAGDPLTDNLNNYPGLNVHFTLVGTNANHPSNSFCQPFFCAGLAQIASDYNAVWALALAYNDASLVRGGLFDKDSTWRTPHCFHRIGRDVDVRANDLTNAIPRNRPDIRNWFTQAVTTTFHSVPGHEYTGLSVEHYHIYGWNALYHGSRPCNAQQ